MSRRAVTSWEALPWYDECRRVRSEVEEKLGQDVESKERLLIQVVIRKADDDKNDGEEEETADLNGLAANGVNCRYREPVTG